MGVDSSEVGGDKAVCHGRGVFWRHAVALQDFGGEGSRVGLGDAAFALRRRILGRFHRVLLYEVRVIEVNVSDVDDKKPRTRQRRRLSAFCVLQ
jgi:hypothetical protein